MIATYDSLIERAVPRYREMTEQLLAYLPRPGVATDRFRILELGCGTGNLSLRLAEAFPGAAITFVDASPEMLQLTEARIREQWPKTAARGSFIAERFESLELGDGSIDLMTSCISLHHVADKGALYRRAHQWLAPGGTFRFADQLAGSSPLNHQLNWQRWLAFCRESSRCSEEEIQSLLDHAEAHDHYTSLEDHFELLHQARFRQVDCVWRNLIWGIVTAEA